MWIIFGPWSDHSRTKGFQFFRAHAVEGIPLCFSTLGEPSRKVNGITSASGGLVADIVLKEVAHQTFLRDSRCTKKLF